MALFAVIAVSFPLRCLVSSVTVRGGRPTKRKLPSSSIGAAWGRPESCISISSRPSSSARIVPETEAAFDSLMLLSSSVESPAAALSKKSALLASNCASPMKAACDESSEWTSIA